MSLSWPNGMTEPSRQVRVVLRKRSSEACDRPAQMLPMRSAIASAATPSGVQATPPGELPHLEKAVELVPPS